VLFIVGDKIVQRETIVSSQDVDARPWPSSAVIVDVAGPGEARRKIARGMLGVPPVVAHRVTVFVVPLGPAGWKATDLITTRPNIPRLTDKFNLR
jgi:hypothetical protein